MLQTRTLILLGAIAGIVELALAPPGSTEPMNQMSNPSPGMAFNLVAFGTTFPPANHSVDLQLVFTAPVTSTATETSTGAASSIQTRPSVSTQPWSTSTSEGTGSTPGFKWPVEPTSTPATTQSHSPASSLSPTWQHFTSTELGTSTIEAGRSTVLKSSSSRPSTSFESSTQPSTSTVFESSSSSRPSTSFESSTQPSTSTVFESSSSSRPSTSFESSTQPSTSTVFESSTQSHPASASRHPFPVSSTAQPMRSASFNPIALIIAILIFTVIIIIIIIFILMKRKRSHSQTFDPKRRKKGKVEDPWAGPVALPEDGGATDGTEEKKDEDLTSKRMSLSTFFGKRKSRAISVLLDDVEVGNAKSPAQESQQPLLSKEPNGKVTDTQSSEERQGITIDPAGLNTQEPSEQELLLPPPPSVQPNGHIQEPSSGPEVMEQGSHDDLPPPPPLGDTVLPIPELGSHEGQVPDSFLAKTSL
ncbi:leukosialin-like [Heterodontus francisci]|uniref:leukosialin-like n=1 Tax=Heterodontus francisci TaxID=7792 RepID=UPI00355C7C71